MALILGFSLSKEVYEYQDLGVKLSRVQVGSMMFEFIEPTTDSSVYQECLNTRGEGIADMLFIVKDVKSETDSLINKGAAQLISTNDYSLFDTRKEGNMIIRLSKE